jgi:crotonobetainyl-CoA:carnitine CoA-transferase CaiB-like acyl-CoA transferase
LRGLLAFPVRFAGETLPEPSKAPAVGEHSDEVLGELLGNDAQRIAKLRSSGVLGDG